MKLPIAQGSFGIILPFFTFSFLFLIDNRFAILSVFSFIFFIYLLWFFRDPPRKIIIDENKILAPADGTIIYTEQDNGFIKIAIRMSPLNVHINRAPLSGKIISDEKIKGKHQSVYFANAEKKNERRLLKMKSSGLEVELLQLTGAFARRIKNWVSINDDILQGQKLGIIRFGSQTNLIVTGKNEFKIVVNKGDKVKAGLSIIAEIV
jgi:phosphatidylserine decarboxylase